MLCGIDNDFNCEDRDNLVFPMLLSLLLLLLLLLLGVSIMVVIMGGFNRIIFIIDRGKQEMALPICPIGTRLGRSGEERIASRGRSGEVMEGELRIVWKGIGKFFVKW